MPWRPQNVALRFPATIEGSGSKNSWCIRARALRVRRANGAIWNAGSDGVTTQNREFKPGLGGSKAGGIRKAPGDRVATVKTARKRTKRVTERATVGKGLGSVDEAMS